jgi:predicted deacylase
LILVPLVNVASFERMVPHVNPVDNKSMNRFYPGTPPDRRPSGRRSPSPEKSSRNAIT